jgi:enoyl-CoA hydratase
MSDGFEVRWIDDGAIFTIDRPAKLNALTKPVLGGLAACLDRLEHERLRLLVVTECGEKAFCAGTDLAEMQGMTMPARLDKSAMARDLFVRLSRSPVVSVAAINGLALGGGLELAMACTFRIAVGYASFGLPEVKLGLLPAYGGTQFLPALIGRPRAEELMLTGRTIDLAEALAIALVHRAAPGGVPLEEAAITFAQEATRHSATAAEAIRACVRAADATITDAGLAVEDKSVLMVFASEEAEVGIIDFLTKRQRENGPRSI